MPDSSSVSQWVDRLQRGDSGAITPLWKRYFGKLVAHARRRSGRTPEADEEDFAAQTLHSFLWRAAGGQFHRLRDRGELWRMLTTILRRKVLNHLRAHHCRKRGGNRASTDQRRVLAEAMRRPVLDSPCELVSLRERYARLLGDLDPEMRRIVYDKLHGYTNLEIAARIQRSLPTVERRVRLLRAKLDEEGIPCRFD